VSAVHIVTDSTAYLAPEVTARDRITVVPLYYSINGGDPAREVGGDEMGPLFERIKASDGAPTTSPPQLEEFLAAYEGLLVDGGSIVSIHLSSGLSETCSIARRAAAELASAGKGGERVQVIDSAGAVGALALLVLVGARAAADGRTAEEAVELIGLARRETRIWFLLDTLEFLKRGGRVGGAAAWIGSTLNVKPILTVESEVRAVERVRTRARGTERLVELGRELHAAGADGWCVQHIQAPDDARDLAERLQQVFWRPPEFIAEVGPVIGAHIGPGALALAGTPARFLD
jgi:DegV family protein with EDD domain